MQQILNQQILKKKVVANKAEIMGHMRGNNVQGVFIVWIPEAHAQILEPKTIITKVNTIIQDTLK